MTDVDEQRIFELDFSCVIDPDNCWTFYQDGTMIPIDKKIFLEEHSESYKEPLKILRNYEKRAAKEISEILKAEAEWRPETEEERKAKWIASRKRETEEYLSRTADLKEALHNRMNN